MIVKERRSLGGIKKIQTKKEGSTGVPPVLERKHRTLENTGETPVLLSDSSESYPCHFYK